MSREEKGEGYMKNFRVLFLVAAILMLGLGAALIFHHIHIPFQLAMMAGVMLFGAVTVTYEYPVNGTTAPTSSTMLQHNALTALVNALDADTVITITHNWGLPSKDGQGFPDGPAGLFPFVIINSRSDSTGTVVPLFLISLTNTNAVVINKPTTVGTQGTYIVQILKPTSLAK
jgi:hypothetical protein